jgi:hypothetical protein
LAWGIFTRKDFNREALLSANTLCRGSSNDPIAPKIIEPAVRREYRAINLLFALLSAIMAPPAISCSAGPYSAADQDGFEGGGEVITAFESCLNREIDPTRQLTALGSFRDSVRGCIPENRCGSAIWPAYNGLRAEQDLT